MKFKSIKIENFMRYKGENTIEFSCDPQKNVTVILGDNTVGKTTIAQAFRWGLYGSLQVERDKTAEDYQLLNNDILAMMNADNKARVSVEIIAEDDENRYFIKREVIYSRIMPQMAAKEFQKKLSMKMSDIDCLEASVTVNDKEIQNIINELFPLNLSHYFLFDGERWSDVTRNGVRENIKASVHTLTGLASYEAALNHLNDMGKNSVIRTFKEKIKGNGNLYDSLKQNRNYQEREIEKIKEKIKTIDINIQNYNTKCIEIEDYLEQNKNTEDLQRQYKQLQVVRRSQNERVITNYKSLVNDFSDKAYMMFAEPLIDSAVKMVKSVAGERRDIPHMRQASIDYIIKSGTCICGNPIREGSHELECLIEQKNYLPPADIGSLLGEFEKTGRRWKNRCDGKYKEFVENAQSVEDSIHDFKETTNQLYAIEKRMEESIDFSEKRRRLKGYKETIQAYSNEKGELLGRISSSEKQIRKIEDEMRSQEARDAETKKWRARLELAEALYDKMKKEFDAKERMTFLELNRRIQTNFERMFNAKDKKIELTKQYEIQMLYQTGNGFREEKNLSEGEKIARNFAFIVTIMEYSQKKKAEKSGKNPEEGDTLPIVLDGPFSKLGDENINLIAKVLPEVSEQVILFMLKKDWEYTGLDDYVGAAYYIDKKAEASYASIKKSEDI